MGEGTKRHIIPYIVGLAPALLVLLTWAPTGDWTPVKQNLRNYALPIAGAELFVFLIAAREGLRKALRRWNWSKPVLAAVAILLVIAVGTAAVAPLRQVATILTIFWIIHGLFAVSVLYLCGRVFEPADLVNAYLVGFAAFVALFFLYLSQIPDWTTFDWKFRFLAFSHIRHVGYYVAAMAALGIGAMAVAKGRVQWSLAWLAASFAFGIALWTGSRGAAVAVVGALLAGLILVPATRVLRCWGGAITAMVAATAVVWLAPAAPSYLMGITRTVEATAKPDVTTGRTTIWKGVIEAIERRPLFGYGDGQMREVATYSVMVQPHNSVLQVALAWGLVGLACALVLAIAFAWRALPAVRTQSGSVVPAFLAMTAIAILSLYDGSLYYPLPTSIFVACGAIIASVWSSASPVREPSVLVGVTS